MAEKAELDPKISRIINHMAVLVASSADQKSSGRLVFKIDFEKGEIPEEGFEQTITHRMSDVPKH